MIRVRGNGREQEQDKETGQECQTADGEYKEVRREADRGDIEPDPRANTLQRVLLIFSAALHL